MRKLPSLMIIGTDTGVGKTVVTALIVKKYRSLDIDALPFKPVASGCTLCDGVKTWSDTAFLATAAGVDEENTALYRFEKPLSPHLAASAEGRTIELSAIVERFQALSKEHDAVLVEGVGGAMVPLNERELVIDLAIKLDLPVVIVTRSNLGTLNHTLLTVNACKDRGLELAGLVINRYPNDPSEAERSNIEELARLTGLPVLGVVPEIAGLSVEDVEVGELGSYVDRIELEKLTVGQEYGRAIEADAKHVWHPFSPMQEYLAEKPHPLMIVKGNGCYLEDSDGKRYLDGVSSLWVNVHGHRKRELDDAIRAQLGKVAHSTLLGLGNEPAALLAEKLVEIAPEGLTRVFYSDNGSTAVEVGLKVAYQYWQQSGRPEKTEFASFVNAYHGDTIGSVSVGGIDLFHAKFAPMLFEANLVPAAYCYRCPIGCAYPGCELACLKELAELFEDRASRIAALVLEPLVQGAAGILTQPPGYIRKVADLCRQHGVLLIVDEVATGFGKTGEMFACLHENIKPDILALAKGVTGGYLPLSATLFREEIYEAFLGKPEESKTFFHGHTYTGNPLAAAVSLANLDLMREESFLPRVRKHIDRFATLLAPLRDLPHVGDIRQCGFMVGIELVADKASRLPYPEELRVGRQVILKARERGIIIRPLGDVIVLMPPLAITEEELTELVGVTAWAISEVTRELD